MNTEIKELVNDRIKEPNWKPMVGLSILIHIMVIIPLFLLSPTTKKLNLSDVMIYQVDLLELPRNIKDSDKLGGGQKDIKDKNPISISKVKGIPGEREIWNIKKKKRRIPKLRIKTLSTTLERESSTKLLEEAISRIKKKDMEGKALRESKSTIQAVQRVKRGGIGRGQGEGSNVTLRGSGSLWGSALSLYQAKVEQKIKGNWAYPVSLARSQDLEAIVEIKVNRAGKIMDISLRKRSSDPLFDESVVKAIKRSDPLPPFPPIYRKQWDEIVIRFTLGELKGG